MAFYKIHKFKEGGTLLYHYDPMVEAVDVSINITTGAVADGDKPGLTHFLEHMLLCDIQKGKEQHGLVRARKFHNHQNGATYLDYVNLNFCTPIRHLEESMEHNGSMLTESTFPEDKIEREKEVVISEMNMYDNMSPDIRATMQSSLIEYCYGQDNDLFTNIIGTEETVRSITKQDLIDYRNKFFNRNNLVIAMAGNVDYQTAKDLCKKYIVQKIPASGPLFIPEVQNVYLRRDFNFIYNQVDSKSSVIQFCFPLNGKQNYKNVVLSTFLNEVLYKRIIDELRMKYGLIYSSYSFDMQFANDGLKIIEIETANDKSNECMRVMASVIGNLVKEGISQEEFLSIKQDFIDDRGIGYTHSIYGKSASMYNSYINNDRIYTDKEKADTFKFLSCEDLNNYIDKVFDTAEVIVNYCGGKEKEELYSPIQIQALFLLNRFTKEELEDYFEYEVPDMACEGDYKLNKLAPTIYTTKESILNHIKSSNKSRKKSKSPAKKGFNDLSKANRKLIIDLFKKNGIDLDEIAEEFYEGLMEEEKLY